MAPLDFFLYRWMCRATPTNKSIFAFCTFVENKVAACAGGVGRGFATCFQTIFLWLRAECFCRDATVVVFFFKKQLLLTKGSHSWSSESCNVWDCNADFMLCLLHLNSKYLLGAVTPKCKSG